MAEWTVTIYVNVNESVLIDADTHGDAIRETMHVLEGVARKAFTDRHDADVYADVEVEAVRK